MLELTLVGGTYEAHCDLALAMAGAPMEGKAVAPDGSERVLRVPLSFALRARCRNGCLMPGFPHRM